MGFPGATATFSSGEACAWWLIASPLIVALTLHWGWRTAFLAPSLMGMAWVLLWIRLYRSPSRHARLTTAEAALISDVLEPEQLPPGTLDLLRLPQTWGLMLCRLLVDPVFQLYIYWLPEFLYRVRGLSLKSVRAFVRYWMGDIGSLAGGWPAGALIRRGLAVPSARRWTLLLGASLCVLGLAVVPIRDPYLAIVTIGVVLLGHTGLSANMFAAVSDVFPSNAVARLTGSPGSPQACQGCCSRC